MNLINFEWFLIMELFYFVIMFIYGNIFNGNYVVIIVGSDCVFWLCCFYNCRERRKFFRLMN